MKKENKFKSIKNCTRYVGCVILILIAVQIGIAIFGYWFEADETVLNDTKIAQQNLSNALLSTFDHYGKLQIRLDYSVRAYIPRENYMNIAYPYRKAAIIFVGKAWCETNGIIRWYCPKVEICDIQNGEILGVYHDLFGFVSKK